jgi:hypothetical protein
MTSLNPSFAMSDGCDIGQPRRQRLVNLADG